MKPAGAPDHNVKRTHITADKSMPDSGTAATGWSGLGSVDPGAVAAVAGDAVARLRATGLIHGAQQVASPNRNARPAGAGAELLVIHDISLPPGIFGGNGIVELFTNRLDPGAHPYYAEVSPLKVSAHLLLRRDGGAIQFVPCRDCAWHAGVSSWNGREQCNDFSIGIELEGTDEVPFTPAQYARLIGVAQVLMRAYPIRHAVGHSDIAPGRKTDPGPHFDWRLFRAATGLR
jgi:N-acetyl-anhydromuramoyl-L-alanine amidase